MIKLTAIAIGTAIALSAGLSITSQSAVGPGAQYSSAAKAVFHKPRIDRANLDVRLMDHMQPSVRQVAERFCLDHGYSGVSDLVVRPSAMTRTITDGVRHADQGGTGQTYSMIECTSQEFTVASTQ